MDIDLGRNELLIRESRIDPHELRLGLLFWDDLVWPTSNAIHVESGPDEQFLEEAGVLTRPRYQFNGDLAAIVAAAQISAFREKEQQSPGSWAIAQGENTFNIAGGLQNDLGGAVVSLHRAIPLPKHDVPLAEILEFRNRRHDELLLLRSCIDDLLAEVNGAEDATEALHSKVKEVDKACANLVKLGREWQSPVYLADLEMAINLNLVKTGAAAYGAWAFGTNFGLTAATLAAGITGLASFVDFKAKPRFRSARMPVSPYRYAFQIHEELA
ncbi:DUF6236 family protein [Ralstonia insidiosa]|uniref:DUF6236 family protein n=1 Tax=Ralstonia insidiosa TaxID=190721 RepID=UPI000CEEACB4|nr:DUF6236 family protein [Ralstonia insidiosa]